MSYGETIMTLSRLKLEEEAVQDTKVDKNKLDRYLLDLPRLSAKWSQYLLNEKLVYESDSISFAMLKKQKYEFYRYDYKYMVESRAGEMQMYLDADVDLVKIKDKIIISKEKLVFIENIIKTLNSAGFNLRTTVDYNKFMAGGY